MAVAAALTCLSACGQDHDAGDPWAREADDLVALLADAYDAADPYRTARFYTAGGTLDLSAFGRGVATTPVEVLEAVEQLWHQQPGFATVEAEHLFVSLDAAVVWWWAYHHAGDDWGGQEWVQSYSFGPGGRTASRAFRGYEPPLFREASKTELAVLDLVGRYVDAWDARDRVALEAIYSPSVVARDDIRGGVWRGADELLSTLPEASPMDLGPLPRLFTYEDGDHVEAIVFVQLGGGCPMLEARRWVLDEDQIVNEVRFTQVPSARRCLTDLPDGWWTTFELPSDLQNNVTEVLDVGGNRVDLINAEPNHEEFARWLFSRYAAAGFGLPDVTAVWFPPSPHCVAKAGLAIEYDERYAGRHTVVVCFDEDEVASDSSESGWSQSAIAYGLHELAHIWMVDHLTDETRAAFNELAGLTEWRNTSVPWNERGVEHAAFTISWGVSGVADARYPIHPKASCEELAARFELLTGHEPVTACGEDGWSP
jgi:hypothetical protein